MPFPRLLPSLAAAVVVALALTGCGAAAPADQPEDEKTTLRFGFNPGPYREMFEQGIQPILEEDGYTVEISEFTDGIITNVALADGEVDAIIMQHPVFQESVNEQEGLHNASLVQVPGPPMALFGGQSDALDDVEPGATVAVPNQPSNMYRAFQVLADVGWIELSDSIDPATASPADISENVAGIEIVAIENAQQVASLSDVDYSVIQGNFVVSGGLDLTDALALEELTDEFSVVVTVDEPNLETAWAKDIKAAYESEEFAAYIAGDPQYAGYNIPDALED
ncbi:MetQ/NlpA family ABC transporter substrate-binding protein [Microbacterium petrolearium]|jgi:D-methionine transport system substrate-binding protein